MKKLSFILLLIALQSKSQSPACIFNKPPVVSIDFGSGENVDASFASLANYSEVYHSCPSDGHYTFTQRTSNCFRGDWHTVTDDHSSGGNMMLVNASYSGGTFFTTPISGLKANTTYEFGVWMMNVCRITDKCPFPLLPNITIRLQTLSGKTLAQFGTGAVLRRETPRWTMYRAVFTTPSSISTVMLTMTNSTPGGCGNDFAMDDITFRECVKPPPVVNTAPKKTSVAKPKPVAPKPTAKKPTQEVVKKKVQPKPIAKEQPVASLPSTSIVTRKFPSFPPPPRVLTNRANPTVKHFDVEAGEVRLDLYDNGEIDGDTVSIYHNNSLAVGRTKLSQKPITLRIAVNAANPHHELVMVAENLGSIPPNTSVMIVTAGAKRYQVMISSTEQKNAKVVFDLKE